MKELSKRDFFYCYTKSLSDYLSEQGIRYIHIAKSMKDEKVFTLYQKTDKLQSALKQFNNEV